MRTVEELLKNNVYREEMSFGEHLAFVNYWFDKYENEGFCDTFESPFDLSEWDSKYKGMKFVVCGRCTLNDCDIETLPMWRIEFEDGHQMDAYPEEICKLERVDLK